MFTEAEVKEAFNDILDVMSGADGGIAFATFYHGILPAILKDIESPASQQLVSIIIHFDRLIRYRNNP